MNPFDQTQAKDLSDVEIREMWVALPNNGFEEVVRPLSPMPLFIMGSKGSGKTHLMRYSSFPLQRLRAPGADALKSVEADGYVGIYLSCQGLNAGRFHGKGHPSTVWEEIFPYFFDLWLLRTAVPVLREMLAAVRPTEAGEVLRRIGLSVDLPTASVDVFESALASIQREVDQEVNNAAGRERVDVTIRWNRGDLIFGIPTILRETVPELKEVKFVYLFDEYENLLQDHQKYVNTLLRERRHPVSFRVGARLWGVRTYSTLSAGEPLKEGSEYASVNLDARLRRSRSSYRRFAAVVVAKRLGLTQGSSAPAKALNAVALLYEGPPNDPLLTDDTLALVKDSPSAIRPYFSRLRSELQAYAQRPSGEKLAASEIDEIIGRLEYTKAPLLEKAAILAFYKGWATAEPLVSTAREIERDLANYARADPNNRVARQMRYFSKDLAAQLYRDYGKDPDFSGFRTLIDMSMGIPRHLLMILQYVHRWAIFLGGDPYHTSTPVSRRAQNRAVKEAADWFFDDSKLTGAGDEYGHLAIEKLGRLLRSVRFAAKPAECSVSGFSVDLTAISERARAVVAACEEASLIVPSRRGQKDRNSKRIDPKYRLNYLLCPRWDLPIASRGVLPLSTEMANAIFDPDFGPQFDQLAKARTKQMNPPFGSGLAGIDQMALELKNG